MTTGAIRLKSYTGKVASAPEIEYRLFEYLRSQDGYLPLHMLGISGGLFDPVTISAGAGNDQITLSSIDGFDQNGKFISSDPLKWNDYLEDVQFPNQTGSTYYIGVKYFEVPANAEVNPNSQQIEFNSYEDGWGAGLDEPIDVVDNLNGTLTLTIANPLVPSSEMPEGYAGNLAMVYFVRPESESGWFEIVPLINDSTYSKITTTTLLTQTSATTETDQYRIALLFPFIMDTDFSGGDWLMIGTVDGNGPSASPTSFDISMQIVFGSLSTNALNILQVARDLYTTPSLDGDGLPNLPEPLETSKVSKSGDTMTGILNLVPDSKFLKQSDTNEGGQFKMEGAGTWTDIIVDQNQHAFRILGGGGNNFRLDTENGILTVPLGGDFKFTGGASLKIHDHSDADSGTNIPLTSITGHDKAVHDALDIDADTLDGNDSTAFFLAANHTKAVHDALGIDADTVDGNHAAAFFLVADHTKTTHDALNIDADTLDGSHAAAFLLLTGGTMTGDLIMDSDLVLENVKSITAKEVGGTERNVLLMNLSDQLTIGNSVSPLFLYSTTGGSVQAVNADFKVNTGRDFVIDTESSLTSHDHTSGKGGKIDETGVTGNVARWGAGAVISVAAGVTVSTSGVNMIHRGGNVVAGAATSVNFGVAFLSTGYTEITVPTGTAIADWHITFIQQQGDDSTLRSLQVGANGKIRVRTFTAGTLTDLNYHFQALRVS